MGNSFLLSFSDLVYIHSPAVKAMLTKMGKHPISFIDYPDYTIFRDMLTEQVPDPNKKYYRAVDVLRVLANKQIKSIDFILSTDQVEEFPEPEPKYLF